VQSSYWRTTVFDPVTSALIAAAPILSRVDRTRLADLITDEYVQVAIARSLLEREVSPTDALFDELRSIGAAQQAIALATDDPDTRRSASFVAASAYRLLSEAFSRNGNRALQTNSISPEIASALLYLVADAAADAAEVATSIESNDDDRYVTLLQLIRHLGRGEVHLGESRATIPLSVDEDVASLGATIGYWKCEQSLLLLLDDLDTPSARPREYEPFGAIASSMESSFDIASSEGEQTASNLIAGPWHLARLLDMAEPVIRQSSAAALSAPPNVDEGLWRQQLSRIVRRRPLLWRNHRSALERGLLDDGVSAVLAFPTGAGKSTMSELKIIATVLRGRNVICLAPTLSLVDQLARAFKQATSAAKVIAQREADDEVVGSDSDTPEIYVMTPESCLSALGLDHERFGDVGLVMFDEAHLMHTEGGSPTRRSLDATLCFLTLSSRFPTADLLLVSAMIANASELAKWLSSITGRRAIALDDPWKPTRQARGALVYNSDEIRALESKLGMAYRTSTTQRAPSSVRAQIQARPYGFFSLRSTWESRHTRDYRLVSLLRDPVPLGVGGKRSDNDSWWLTPNANKVAAHLASAAAQSGMKTLVFTHQVGWTVSIARDVAPDSLRRTTLVPAERRLVARIIDALGDASGMYIDIDGEDVLGEAIPHHGLLLPDERRLHERLYQRSDGVPVMVATSTVTQGMNFPSEFVLITSDRRFDAATNSRARVESHELLNAAGRAGRAGSHSNALVLVIPGDVVGYDGGTQISGAWEPLRDTFSNSDQCIELEDPLIPLLAALDDDVRPPLLDYLVRRLDSVEDLTVGPELLHRSLSAYRSRTADHNAWIEEKITRLSEVVGEEGAEPWARRCALVSGLPLPDVRFVADRLDAVVDEPGTIESWSEWVLDLLTQRPLMAEATLRVGSRAALTGAPEDLDEWAATGTTLVGHLKAILPLWLRGDSLTEIQEVGIERRLAKPSDSKLTFARKFVLRVVPDLSYLFSLPALVQAQRAQFGNGDPLPEGHPLLDLGRCVELGVDSGMKIDLLSTRAELTRRDLRSNI
jgi:hypothetical protein